MDYYALASEDISYFTNGSFHEVTKYEKEDKLKYGDIETHYIREISDKITENGNHLWEKEYQFVPLLTSPPSSWGRVASLSANYQVFVYNWENFGHVYLNNPIDGSQGAAGDFATYLKGLSKYMNDNYKDLDNSLYDPVSGLQRPQFNVVAHSTGGLVTRYYIENIFRNQGDEISSDLKSFVYPNISKFVAIAVPNWGSNLYKNTGFEDSTTLDLDRDDSYLFYKDDSNVDVRFGETLSLIHTGTNGTDSSKYYAIAGVVANDTGYRWGGFEDDDQPILIRARELSEKQEQNIQLLNQVNEVLKAYGQNTLPNLNDNPDELHDEDPVHSGVNWDWDFGFGDEVVYRTQ